MPDQAPLAVLDLVALVDAFVRLRVANSLELDLCGDIGLVPAGRALEAGRWFLSYAAFDQFVIVVLPRDLGAAAFHDRLIPPSNYCGGNCALITVPFGS